MTFLRGWWEYVLFLVLACGAWVTGSGWFVVALCGGFLFACRRTNRG